MHSIECYTILTESKTHNDESVQQTIDGCANKRELKPRVENTVNMRIRPSLVIVWSIDLWY